MTILRTWRPRCRNGQIGQPSAARLSLGAMVSGAGSERAGAGAGAGGRCPGRERLSSLECEPPERPHYIGAGIMLLCRLAIIQHDPVIMRKTMSRPKARARILFV